VVREPHVVQSSIGLGRAVRRHRADHDRAREPGDGRAAVRAGPRLGPCQQHPPAPAAGPGRRRRSAGADLLGRHAPQARPRREPGRPCCCCWCSVRSRFLATAAGEAIHPLSASTSSVESRQVGRSRL
jgi:hypothetical protein